jgi:hypothetical protein
MHFDPIGRTVSPPRWVREDNGDSAKKTPLIGPDDPPVVAAPKI